MLYQFRLFGYFLDYTPSHEDLYTPTINIGAYVLFFPHFFCLLWWSEKSSPLSLFLQHIDEDKEKNTKCRKIYGI